MEYTKNSAHPCKPQFKQYGLVDWPHKPGCNVSPLLQIITSSTGIMWQSGCGGRADSTESIDIQSNCIVMELEALWVAAL